MAEVKEGSNKEDSPVSSQRETSVPYGALSSRDVRLLSPALKATSKVRSHRNACRNQPHPRGKEKKRKGGQVQVQKNNQPSQAYFEPDETKL